MSLLDDLNKSLDNQDSKDDEILEAAKKLSEVAPRVEERKRERDAKRKFLNSAPSDFVEESAAKFLQFEKADEQKLTEGVRGLLSSTNKIMVTVNSTSGTSSAYVSEGYAYVRSSPQASQWFTAAIVPFDELAKYKSQTADIPARLEKVFEGSGNLFSAAVQSVEKAKLDLQLQSDSIMAMRNFIQSSFWGNLIALAKEHNPSLWRGVQRSKLSQADTRDLVAKSLSKNSSDESKLVELLQNMSDLCNEMSGTGVGKNLAFDNPNELGSLFTRWLLVIDDITRLVTPD